MPSYKVTYFNFKGLGEPIRFILSYGDVDFEDERIDRENWSPFKPLMPFGQVPILEVDGKKSHQTSAIARYLAKQFGIAGKNDWEALDIDATVDTLEDLRMRISLWKHEPNSVTKKEKYGTLSKEIIPFYLERLDAQVKKNGGYFAGGTLSWADLWFTAMLDYMNFSMEQSDIIKNYGNLKQLSAKVLELPNIKAWVEKRPVTDR